MKAQVLRFSEQEAWEKAFVEIFLRALEGAARAGRPAFHAVLAGGSTPGPLYRSLASSAEAARATALLPVHLWIGDERSVPASDPRRNGGMVARSLAAASRWPRPPVLHLWPEGEREAACSGYAAELSAWLGPALRFDLCVLGMGADGHTAGLFTLDQVGAAGGALALATEAPGEPRLRVTLGPAVLGASRRIVVALSGREKAPMLGALLSGLATPLSAVAKDEALVLYLEAGEGPPPR